MRRNRRIQDYVKYTEEELARYTETSGSCIHKINTNLHFGLGPHVLADLQNYLAAVIVQKKVGFYDTQLKGIILDARNIRIVRTTASIRAEDSKIHINVNADCYVFRPERGAILSGVVKHISAHHVGVVIYRVFNVSIRFKDQIKREINLEDELQFKIIDFNIQNTFPYIEGALLKQELEQQVVSSKKIVFDVNGSAEDSGIEEKCNNQDIDFIKTEAASPSKVIESATPRKRKRPKTESVSDDSATPATTTIDIKSESPSKSSKSQKRKSKKLARLEGEIKTEIKKES